MKKINLLWFVPVALVASSSYGTVMRDPEITATCAVIGKKMINLSAYSYRLQKKLEEPDAISPIASDAQAIARGNAGQQLRINELVQIRLNALKAEYACTDEELKLGSYLEDTETLINRALRK